MPSPLTPHSYLEMGTISDEDSLAALTALCHLPLNRPAVLIIPYSHGLCISLTICVFIEKGEPQLIVEAVVLNCSAVQYFIQTCIDTKGPQHVHSTEHVLGNKLCMESFKLPILITSPHSAPLHLQHTPFKSVIDALQARWKRSMFNEPDADGKTLMFHAIMKNNAGLVEFLLSKGVEPTDLCGASEKVESHRLTALQLSCLLASERADVAVFQTLLSATPLSCLELEVGVGVWGFFGKSKKGRVKNVYLVAAPSLLLLLWKRPLFFLSCIFSLLSFLLSSSFLL
jgi:hypothetical protein